MKCFTEDLIIKKGIPIINAACTIRKGIGKNAKLVSLKDITKSIVKPNKYENTINTKKNFIKGVMPFISISNLISFIFSIIPLIFFTYLDYYDLEFNLNNLYSV